jgi:cholest-4-en-3-one 26-monooxygenase
MTSTIDSHGTTSHERLVVDLLDPELYRRNPHDVWTWMRANEPVYRDHRNGLWGVTRHADLMDVERRSSVFVSGMGYRAIWNMDEVNMIAQDDPRHRQQRMLVQPKFTRAAVSDRRPELQDLTDELVGAFVGDGELEVIDQLAGQLPPGSRAALLGYDEDQWRNVKSWSERLMRIDMRERDGKTFTEFIDANIEFAIGFAPVAMERMGCPADDLVSIWVNAEIDGQKLPQEALIHEVGLFISGGAETTRTAISHGLRAFADHPDQWEAMAEDPSLVPGAVEEVLRWVTPLNNMFRRAAVDDHIGDQPVQRGDRVILLYPSANRDEAVFDDPFRFDIRRSPNPQVSFGFGTHMCVGNNLARATLAIVFGTLAQRITDLRVITEPDVEPNIFARAVRSFRLGFTPR